MCAGVHGCTRLSRMTFLQSGWLQYVFSVRQRGPAKNENVRVAVLMGSLVGDSSTNWCGVQRDDCV